MDVQLTGCATHCIEQRERDVFIDGGKGGFVGIWQVLLTSFSE